jgi:hypothetical protein
MEKDNKQLLIRDICARLPYGVHVKFKQYNEPLYLSIDDKLAIYNGGELINDLQYLYLRPMSSMTEEERRIMDNLWKDDNKLVFADPSKIRRYRFYDISVVDFLNSNHFDYRGLIEKGLALEATEGMYNIKTE